ncbi:hypothetical protein ZWY2020_030243 [Hordeum vulgare]|nr:hypothetical protein ZWY2020_030243 [Hordeum vulgare]
MAEAGPVLSMAAFAKEPSPVKPGACGTVVRERGAQDRRPWRLAASGATRPGRSASGKADHEGVPRQPGGGGDRGQGRWLHRRRRFVDDDDEIFIVDRLKEPHQVQGFQVAPPSSRPCSIAHPGIVDAAVVPGMFVVPRLSSEGADMTEDEIKQYVAKQVVFYKRLQKVFFVSSIPKGAVRKILRKDPRAKLPPERADGG